VQSEDASSSFYNVREAQEAESCTNSANFNSGEGYMSSIDRHTDKRSDFHRAHQVERNTSQTHSDGEGFDQARTQPVVTKKFEELEPGYLGETDPPEEQIIDIIQSGNLIIATQLWIEFGQTLTLDQVVTFGESVVQYLFDSEVISIEMAKRDKSQEGLPPEKFGQFSVWFRAVTEEIKAASSEELAVPEYIQTWIALLEMVEQGFRLLKDQKVEVEAEVQKQNKPPRKVDQVMEMIQTGDWQAFRIKFPNLSLGPTQLKEILANIEMLPTNQRSDIQVQHAVATIKARLDYLEKT
jgi:hypothetical protein